MTAWQSVPPGEPLSFRPRRGWRQIEIACGRCIGCRLRLSREWAVRCVHEASLHEDNAFLTLTYDDDHLPSGGDLNYPDVQAFLKRLRRRIEPTKIKFFCCGEYGDKTLRPHYHLIIFGWYPPDAVLLRRSSGGNHYTSDIVRDCWRAGHIVVGGCTYQSAAYVARYCLKKRGGDQAREHYRRVDPVTGETWEVQPEFVRMSLKDGGIAADWIRQYWQDIYPSDRVVLSGGKTAPVPRRYDRILKEEIDPYLYDYVRDQRVLRAMDAGDNSPERLAAKEEVAKSRYAKRGEL